ncbi:hypothetical protein CCMSSC00406_0008133 [Pleurotus cornucopiae]|uniref:Uncharacterized protein n=1 Tax=Pleurotus cornucopiae TaxID=5321 RepID=A0ACB7IRR5_PLECO|nr:hypothetical protein CCMSSC00406_0008133 [Pleurotus cornucopiae]
MLTIKLVVIGASGVGKTSLRGQYISGQFSTGYRATIGADFISKTLPHPRIAGESIMLQIWDTAGQERFSSLSSAFYRGADAVILMFDVNKPETLYALRKWWSDFCERAPLGEEDMEGFCCVVVGNKMDLVGTEHGAPDAVPPDRTWDLIHELMPSLFRPPSPPHDHPTPNPIIATQLSEDPIDIAEGDEGDDGRSPHAPSDSIAIRPRAQRRISLSPKRGSLRSHSRASSRFYTGTMTTVNTMHSTATIYHTPASSISNDIFHSARTSPEHSISSSSVSLPLRATSPNSTRSRRNTAFSTSSASSDGGATITPGMFARGQRSTSTLSMSTTPQDNTSLGRPSTHPPSPLHGPQLFYTSAKTGEGVREIFEQVAQRVVGQWEYDEAIEAKRLHMQEASTGASETIKAGLNLHLGGRWGGQKGKGSSCCA